VNSKQKSPKYGRLGKVPPENSTRWRMRRLAVSKKVTRERSGLKKMVASTSLGGWLEKLFQETQGGHDLRFRMLWQGKITEE